jgi:hypothetical protein
MDTHVYMGVYLCIYVGTYLYAVVHMHVYTCVHGHMYTHVCYILYTHTYIVSPTRLLCTLARANLYRAEYCYGCLCIHVHIYVCMNTHIRMCVHLCMYMCAYVYVLVHIDGPSDPSQPPPSNNCIVFPPGTTFRLAYHTHSGVVDPHQAPSKRH